MEPPNPTSGSASVVMYARLTLTI
jgi:hypothetical protein